MTATLTTLVSFNNRPLPFGSLIADANGNLFGTTAHGGASNEGTVFELVKSGSTYSLTTLISFNGSNGAFPFGSLIADANGNLFGTTHGDGANNDGTVFELVKDGSTYTLTTLVSFNGSNGAAPSAGLIADANGNLFGTTYGDGINNYGTVFELVKSGSTYTLTTLVSFNGSNGANPMSGLIADANGNLFGTTYGGGANNYGTVFELVKSGSAYTFTTLVSFNVSNGACPTSGLIADVNGDLFGTTYVGGANGAGTVFELVKSGSTYSLTTLVSFNDSNGGNPASGLIADANGDLFGTTYAGGANGDGTVFELVKSGSTYTLATLISFNGSNGVAPVGGLIADANGDLFGTTEGDGANSQGTVFEITNSGFVIVTPTVLADRTGVKVGATVTADAAHGVLANDTDPITGDTLHVSAVNGLAINVGHTITIMGSLGSLTLGSDGSYTYAAFSNDVLPASGVGQDVFTYTARVRVVRPARP